METKTEFTFRKLVAEDKPAILSLCSKIWDGDDYIPSCFDAWVADDAGSFTACLYEGRIVGLGKLTFLAPGHAWLEGLRKDPEAKVRGVGKALCRNALGELKKTGGVQSIRFSTYFMNAESISLNESLGFVRLETHSCKSKKLSDKDAARCGFDAAEFSIARISDPSVSINAMRAHGWFEKFLCMSWKAYPATDPKLMSELAAEGLHWQAIDKTGRCRGSIWFSADPQKRQLNVVGLDADGPEAACALFSAAEKACLDAGYDYVEAMVPPEPRLLGLFAAGGYVSWEQENDFLIYELPLEKLNNF